MTDQVSEIPAGLGALEHGADRIIVEVPDAGVLDLLEAHLEIVEPPGAQWQLVPVTGHRPAGLGDRVIIDTTSILKSSEGMLVGSAAALLLHVASEAVGSKFTRPRAFRVNAGAAHSYALMADGTTRYLSEIGPGDAVLIADPILGTFRSARVGRVKTERRPIRMVEVDHEGRTFTVFLQDAETVRLTTETGAVSTTELQSGVRVFAIPCHRPDTWVRPWRRRSTNDEDGPADRGGHPPRPIGRRVPFAIRRGARRRCRCGRGADRSVPSAGAGATGPHPAGAPSRSRDPSIETGGGSRSRCWTGTVPGAPRDRFRRLRPGGPRAIDRRGPALEPHVDRGAVPVRSIEPSAGGGRRRGDRQ